VAARPSAPKRTRRGSWPKPTRRGIALIAVGAIVFVNALFLDRRDLILVALIAIAVPLLALVFVAARRLAFHVGRSYLPQVAEAGGSATVTLIVRNALRRSTDGATWRDVAAPGLTAAPPTVLPALGRYEGGPDGGDDTVRLEYTIHLPRRGVFPLGPLLVGVADPFGLASLEREFGEPHDLIVTPRVVRLGRTEQGEASIDGVLQELLRQTHPNADELIAREYRHGDPLRRINWPATARHGELMVRQEEQRSNPEARLIIDTAVSGRGRGALFSHGGRYDHGFELGMEIAASVGVHLLEAGFQLQVTETGESALAPGPERARGGLFGDPPVSYSRPGGDGRFLEGLAHIPVPDPSVRSARGDGEREGGMDAVRATGIRSPAQRPGFAVLVDIDEHEALALARIRRTLDPAVAFVLDSVRRIHVDELVDAGWLCLPVRSARDIPGAWASIDVSQRGVRDAS
jgi:uncharacterized protein (DUF58 family)